MKILILTTSYPQRPGESKDTGVFIEQFAAELQRRGHAVRVVAPERGGKADPHSVVSAHFFKILPGRKPLVSLSVRRPYDLLRAASVVLSGGVAVAREAGTFRPDLTLCCWVLPTGLWGLAGRMVFRTPYAVWALGSDVWKMKSYPMGQSMFTSLVRNAAFVFGNSETICGRVKEITGQDCRLLRSGRVLEFPDRKEPRDRNGLVCIGRLHPDKGQDVLVEAFSQVAGQFPEARLTLYGAGPMQEKLQQLITKYKFSDRVVLAGNADAAGVAAALATAGALVIPSRVESMPLIFSEGLQAGVPIIASDTGDMGVLMKRHSFGALAEPGNPASLAARLQAFLAGATLAAAPTSLKEEFHISNIVEHFLETVIHG